LERPGTIEHLAARQSRAALDASTPEIKQQLAVLRTEITRLLTGLRWQGDSVEETAEQIIPLLNLGPVQQWKLVLLPFLREIDRAGNMIPVWLKIIERGDMLDLPADTNPAETVVGRARRFAILMLGYYKTSIVEEDKLLGFSKHSPGRSSRGIDITGILGKLAIDPNTSLYAVDALLRQGTNTALATLISALKDAEGWARVDLVEGCLKLERDDLYDLLIASGLDRVSGLEHSVAIPIYHKIPLENYLRGQGNRSGLMQQAALIFSQILQESMKPPIGESKNLPTVFEHNLPTVAKALFEGARQRPLWQNTIALHQLGLLLGHYWRSITRGELKETRILEQIYPCLPMMNDVERWMMGPGRDALLAALLDEDEEGLQASSKVLGELRETRAIMPLLQHIERTQELTSVAQALTLEVLCDTLVLLGERRAITPLLQFLHHVVDINKRAKNPERRDNLSTGDADIPGSIVYAAIVRACGELGERDALDDVLRAMKDCDPYVRIQAIEAIKRLDPRGEDLNCRTLVREALNDPCEQNVRATCQLILQYRDTDALPLLRQIIDKRPALAPIAYDTLHRLEQ
jgi:HEAT repeat protein